MAACVAGAAQAAAAQNVLVIIADDYGVDSSSLYNSTPGASIPPTPVLASLAAGGVQFENAYATPLCSPTRACMLTGRHGFRTGVGEAVSLAAGNQLQASEFTLPEAFAASPGNGFRLAQFGKWHLTAGPNTNLTPATIGGWPHFSGELGGSLASYTSWSKVTTDGTPAGTTAATSTTYHTTDVVNDAVAWITAQNQAGNPWFAWVAFAAPHTPFHKPPAALCPHYAGLPGTQAHINANQRLYYEAAIEAMDTEIGRLLSAVDRNETNILFLADNGTPAAVLQPPVPSGHGKDTLYEGGIRVPFIANGPAVTAPGRKSGAMVHVVDAFSTILELAGVPVPTGAVLDSISFLPVLRNLPGSRTAVYSESIDASQPSIGGRALRSDRYKLIRFRDGREELYDLSADPWETVNLFAGSITADQQAAYHELRLGLSRFSAAASPAVTQSSLAGGVFSVSLPVVSGAVQTLWRAAAPSGPWSPVAGATSVLQAATLTISDPSPPAGRAFYLVLTETP